MKNRFKEKGEANVITSQRLVHFKESFLPAVCSKNDFKGPSVRNDYFQGWSRISIRL
jgi:hypothetical protein